jgi:hypothetical protein
MCGLCRQPPATACRNGFSITHGQQARRLEDSGELGVGKRDRRHAADYSLRPIFKVFAALRLR